MTSYLILDGYNVIGALERYRGAESFDAARELLITDVFKAAGWTGGIVVVVFDAHRSPEPRRDESRAGGRVRIVYSGYGESADDVIERFLTSLDGSATVYTADFALQRATLAQGSTRATPREFAELLDELPAVTRTPDRPHASKLGDYISPETMLALEKLRRNAAE